MKWGDSVNGDRADRVERLLERARALDGEERQRFLDQECGADTSLREELSRLLSGEGVDPEFIAALRQADTETALEALKLDYTNAQLGDFRLGRSLGQGATGVVHEAVQLSVDRTVAVKVLAPMMVSNAERLERFRREAYSQSRLRHQHVAAAFYFGSARGIPYLAMERVHGKSLREHIAHEHKRLESAQALDPRPQFDPFDPRTAAGLIAKVAAALDYCHRQGVIHRDIKPNNILIDESFEPRIIDFGIARDQSLASMTRTSDVSGTPWYMSPEQARARKHQVSHRTDIYSAGAVLYEMLTQQPPFPGTDSLAVLDSICNDRLKSVRSVNPNVPRALERICHKALEKDPGLRYATALELADDLRSFLAGEPVVARSPSIVRRIRIGVRERPMLAALTLVVFAAASTVAYEMRSGRAHPTGSAPREEHVGYMTKTEYLKLSKKDQLEYLKNMNRVYLGLLPDTDPSVVSPPKSK